MKQVAAVVMTLLISLTAASGERLIPDGFPSAETTGIAGAGLTLDDMTENLGYYTVTVDNTVLERKKFGKLTIKADNVTVRECYFDQGEPWAIDNQYGATGLLIEDCTFVGKGQSVALSGRYTARRCDISGYQDGAKIMSGCTLEDSYIHDLWKASGTHNDGIQMQTGCNLVGAKILHNTILGPWQTSTSAIITGAETGETIDNTVIADNFLSGGAYCVYFRNQGGTGPINSSLSHNVWEDGSWQFQPLNYSSHATNTVVCNFDQYGYSMSFNDSANPVATPEISPDGGFFDGGVTVSISCATAGAEIRYTTDHSNVTSSSPLYSGPFTVSARTHVKARAFKSGMDDSMLAFARFAPFQGTIRTIDAGANDQVVRSDGTFRDIAWSVHRVGRGVAGADGAAVLPFALPSLAADEVIVGADFDIKFDYAANSPLGAVDLYALGYRTSSYVQTGDFYLGAFDADATDAWALQDDFATPSTSGGILSADGAAQEALTSYILDQYDAGAGAGDYVFLRLNPDTVVANYRYWVFQSANGSPKPTLEIWTTDAPTADAGSDVEVDDDDDTGAEKVTLNASASSDSDGVIVKYLWEENSSELSTKIAPAIWFSVGVHTVDLTVTDDAGATGTDTVTVTVNAYVSPFIALDAQSLTAYDYQDGQNSLPTTATVSGDGEALTLEGNAWKLHPYTYTVTADTVMQFTFDADDVGEIVGLVLDNNTTCLDTRNGFRFGGADVDLDFDYFSWKLDRIYTAGGGAKTYVIPVGEYFTGSCNYLGFFADDDADGSCDVTFSDMRIVECAAEAFDEADLDPYGTMQDGQDSSYTAASASLDGLDVTLEGNAWKVHPFSATVNVDSVLVVTIDASDAGEIIGVALDNDTEPTEGRRAFIFGGSQYDATSLEDWSWVVLDPDTSAPYSAGGGAKTYVIPVGQYLTGEVNYIGFIADDDDDASTDVTFSDIRLF